MNAKTFMAVMLALIAVFASASAKEPKRPETYNYQRGIEAYYDDNLDQAADYFSREISENPKNSGYANIWLAYIYYAQENYGWALNSATKAIKDIPSSDKLYKVLSLNERALIYTALADTTKALNDLAKSIKIDPKHTETYNRRGQLLFEMGKYAESDKDYETIIKLEEGSVLGYMGKARNANSQERYEDALPLLNHVISMAKEYSQAYSYRALTYLGLKKYDDAADDIVTGLGMHDEMAASMFNDINDKELIPYLETKLRVKTKIEPQNNLWPIALGIVLENKKEYQKAIDCFMAANKIDASSKAMQWTADCYSSLGDFDSAIHYIDKALELTPDNTAVLLAKAEILSDAGKTDECLEIWDKIIEQEPDNPGAYYAKGMEECCHGMTDAAIDDLSLCIALIPGISSAYSARADMYTRKGETEKAAADYRKVLELDTVPNSSSRAMYALQGLGRKAEAIEYMDKVIADNIDDEGVYYDAACLYTRIGDYPKALEMLRTSLEKGYDKFPHIATDYDLDPIRELPEFKALIDKYKPKMTNAAKGKAPLNETVETVEVPFTKAGGITKVKCEINGLPLHFIFDTGASDVTISMVEANFMLKNDYISKKDIIGSSTYWDANGDLNVGTVINLKEVTFGGLVLKDVKASVVRNQKAPLLLGQTVLGRLGKIEIDNTNMKLKITHTTTE